MIHTHRQYRLTQTQAASFEATLRAMEQAGPTRGVDTLLYQAQLDSLRSILDDLRMELADYESTRFVPSSIPVFSVADLSRALIQARMDAGLTQSELAQRLGLSEGQVVDYETTAYVSASLADLVQVSEALNVRLEGELQAAAA